MSDLSDVQASTTDNRSSSRYGTDSAANELPSSGQQLNNYVTTKYLLRHSFPAQIACAAGSCDMVCYLVGHCVWH